MIRRIIAVLLFLAVAVLARPALAQNYSMSYALEPNAWIGPIDLSWSETVGSNTVDYNFDDVAAGPQIISFNGTPPPGYSQSYVAYCVDMYHWDQSPSTVTPQPFAAVSTLADDNAANDGLTQAQFNQRLDQAAWLYDTYNPTVQSASGIAEQEDGAALQLAIWEIMAGSGSGFTFTNAGVNASEFSTVESLTSTYYNSVGSNVGSGTLFQIDRSLEADAGQDLLGPNVAPEGSSLVLLIFGLAAPLGLLALRARRRNTTA